MEAVAIHDFASSDMINELSFKRGDKINILNYGDNVQWYNGEKFTPDKGYESGIVPENYIEIKRPSWYMGRLSRSAAERTLHGNHTEGAFLVRLSESIPTMFSLSVKCGDAVQHFRIQRDNASSKYFLWSDTFESLNALVDHYRTESVSRTSQILLQDMDHDGFVVRARYTFVPEKADESELGFQAGDLITVFDSKDENWWGGTIGDRIGYFPRTWVEPFTPSNIHC